MAWNRYIKDYFVITADILHTADTGVQTTPAITVQNAHVIVANWKKNQTAYESTRICH